MTTPKVKIVCENKDQILRCKHCQECPPELVKEMPRHSPAQHQDEVEHLGTHMKVRFYNVHNLNELVVIGEAFEGTGWNPPPTTIKGLVWVEKWLYPIAELLLSVCGHKPGFANAVLKRLKEDERYRVKMRTMHELTEGGLDEEPWRSMILDIALECQI